MIEKQAEASHVLRIDGRYAAGDAVHYWRAHCSCGWKGPERMSPRLAERDGTQHNGEGKLLGWVP